MKTLWFVFFMPFFFTPVYSDETEDFMTVYVSDKGSDVSGDGSEKRPYFSLYKGFSALTYGGLVVVSGGVAINEVTSLPFCRGVITVSSVRKGTDYRKSEGGEGIINVKNRLILNSPVVFENIDFHAMAKNTLVVCNGNYARFGKGITSTRDRVANDIGITAGGGDHYRRDGSYIEILSGKWFRIRGGNRMKGEIAGDTYIRISGGSVASLFEGGGVGNGAGNINILIEGGNINGPLLGTATGDFEGNINITVAGGRVNSGIRAANTGALSGNATVNVFTNIKGSVGEGNAKVGGDLLLNLKAGCASPSASGFNINKISAAAARELLSGTIDKFNNAKLAKLNPYKNATDAFVTRVSSGRNIVATNVCNMENGTGANAPFHAIYGAPVRVASDFVCGGGNTYAFLRGAKDKTEFSGSVMLPPNGVVEIYFNTHLDGERISQANGYMLEIYAENKTLTAFSVESGRRVLFGERKFDFTSGVWYPFKILRDGKFAEIYFNENPLDRDPYPKFNFELDKKGDLHGFFMAGEDTKFKDYSLSAYTRPDAGAVYKNPIIVGMTDPEVFYKNGLYYVYGAEGRERGVSAYITRDFVNFKKKGFVLKKDDAFGDGIFKAANIIEHEGLYYMFYMAASKALGTTGVTAYAVSKSPAGPFRGDLSSALTSHADFIGGQPFVDDDGKVYITFVRTTSGNILWAAELKLSGGRASVDFSTAKIVISPSEEWENAKAPVTECGYIIKHNGYYYMLYSGGNYNSSYGMGYAVSDKPLGDYIKHEFNPVLKSTDQAFGVGAVSIFASPDGKKHYIIYLRNHSPTVARPLATSIDRIKFVKNPSGGPDIISVGGPTVSPMPVPSTKASPAGDYQKHRFVW